MKSNLVSLRRNSFGQCYQNCVALVSSKYIDTVLIAFVCFFLFIFSWVIMENTENLELTPNISIMLCLPVYNV